MSQQDSIDEAVARLDRGEVVALPTETVYGLAALATSDAAVDAIFELKGRPRAHPLIIHLADADWLHEWTLAPSALALRLAEAFWPGPLTLVLRPSPRVSDRVTGGQPTVAVRVPAHPLAREVLRRLGRPLAAPSANRFGKLSPTRAQHVRDEFGNAVFVLDGGACSVGVESTIVDVISEGSPRILRPGGVTREQLEACAGISFLEGGGAVRVPGALASHYAPRATVEIVSTAELSNRVDAAAAAGLRVGVLSFGDAAASDAAASHATATSRAAVRGALAEVRLPSDLTEAARELYAALRSLDAQGLDRIFVCLPADEGVGRAIVDRLRRAAGPRD